MPEVDLNLTKVGKAKRGKSGSKEAWKNKRKRETKKKKRETGAKKTVRTEE